MLGGLSRSRDPKFLKKLTSTIWEFRTYYSGIQYRLFAFWDKTDSKQTLVIATHGVKKKTDKINQKEIDKANQIRNAYFKNK